MPLVRFVEDIYLPHLKSEKRASTYRGYRHIWNKDLKPRLQGGLVREIRTWDAEKLMRRIAAESDLSHSTLMHVKSVLSAIFAHAKRCGAINGVNPIQDVSIPKGRESEETYAYSLEEIYRMLDLLLDRQRPCSPRLLSPDFARENCGDCAGRTLRGMKCRLRTQFGIAMSAIPKRERRRRPYR